MAVKRVHATANLASENGLHHSSPADLKTLHARYMLVKVLGSEKNDGPEPQEHVKSIHALFVCTHDGNTWAHTIKIP